jgi:hypothetical protein
MDLPSRIMPSDSIMPIWTVCLHQFEPRRVVFRIRVRLDMRGARALGADARLRSQKAAKAVVGRQWPDFQPEAVSARCKALVGLS